MATLRETVLTEEQTPNVLRDCEALLEAEVRGKKGVSGFAVKSGYKVVKTFKRGFLQGVLADLVPEFCDALEPLHERFGEETNGSLGSFLASNDREATSLMLGVTDGKAAGSSNRTIKKIYNKLRPPAERHVRDAIPGLSELIDKYYSAE